MECAAKQAASARVLQALSQPCRNQSSSISSIHRQHLSAHRYPLHPTSARRYASSSASDPPPKPKQVVLEKPDKFRPPSHAARRNARSTTGMYGGGAAFNQEMSEAERLRSMQKKYPHMFPNEGTTMHWFLTTKWVHVFISLVGLPLRFEVESCVVSRRGEAAGQVRFLGARMFLLAIYAPHVQLFVLHSIKQSDANIPSRLSSSPSHSPPWSAPGPRLLPTPT